jgi:hypothetical protein
MNRAKIITTLIALLSFVPAIALADVDMSLDELPEAVRQTALREVKGGTITDIEREIERGATVYEVEFIDQNIKYELDIAADGTLLRRHRD